MGACREGCFHGHTPLQVHMITMHHPPPKHHPSQRPGIPLFQRSVLPSHPLTTPRPPTIVYPHRASSTPPLASASAPPHEPYLFLAADPTQRASSYVPLRVHRVTVAPTPSYVAGGDRDAAEAARAGKLRSSCGRECDEGARDPGGGIARSASPAVTVPAVPAVTTTRTSSVSGSTDSPRSAGEGSESGESCPAV